MLPYYSLLAAACAFAWWLLRVLFDAVVAMLGINPVRREQRVHFTLWATLCFAAFTVATWISMGGKHILPTPDLRSAVLFGLTIVCSGLVIVLPFVVRIVLQCSKRDAVRVGLTVAMGFAVGMHLLAVAVLIWRGYWK